MIWLTVQKQQMPNLTTMQEPGKVSCVFLEKILRQLSSLHSSYLRYLYYLVFFIISVANADPSCSNVIILKKPNRKNRFIICPFDVYSIRLYYAELVEKKENNQEKAKKIKGKIIIREFDDANILYEDRFEIPLIRGKSYIYSSIYNIISHQTPLIRFHRNSDFFLKSWQIVLPNDSKKRTYLNSHKKYEIMIDFDQDLPASSFLYARILGDIEDCYAEQQFEYVKEVKH